jgi:serine/threonine-protein kinase
VTDILEGLQQAIADRYQVERELGRGGMATVYLATDVRHDRRVAIKVLHPDLSATIGSERFEREIKLAARLQHPHILGLHDSGAAGGLLYYVMPFVEGESVRDRLDRERQLPIEDALQIILEVADALGYAHAQNIIHRDIKPENVMLANGHALVADFGIARARTEAGQQRLTQTGMAVGTPLYMSPEQATGDTVGPAADIYSLGCMLYEMLAGEPPFTGPNAIAIMAKHAMEAVPSVRIVRASVPEEVEEAILAAMEKSAADRPRSAAEFCEILGTPLGATAARRVTMRHTAARRVPTPAQPVHVTPWWKRPLAVAAGSVGLVVASYATWAALSSPPAVAAVGDAFSEKKIAVLYFDDATNGKLGYLGDGLTETLIDQLKQVRGLEVLSKDAVGRFRGRNVSTDSIIRVLEPGTIVKGSVSEDADKVRVSVRVIDGNSGAEKGDGLALVLPATDELVLRQAVSDSVSQYLRSLIGGEIRARQLESGTSNSRAWALVQRAEKLRKDGAAVASADSTNAWTLFAQADSLLAQAAGLDGRWATPVALRAVLNRTQAGAAKSQLLKAPFIERGLIHAEHALQLDEDNLDARQARGQLRFDRWRTQTGDNLLDGARDDLTRVTTADRTRALAWVTLSAVEAQRHEQLASYEAAKRAYEEDAYSSFVEGVVRQMWATMYDLQQFTQAQRHCDEGARRFPRNWAFISCKLWMVGTTELATTPDSAWEMLRNLADRVPETAKELETRRHQMFAAAVLAQNNEQDSARRVIERARTDDPRIDPAGNLLLAEALTRVRLGTSEDSTVAFERLREYVNTQPLHGKGFADTGHWWWKDLRKDPRWDRYLRAGIGS